MGKCVCVFVRACANQGERRRKRRELVLRKFILSSFFLGGKDGLAHAIVLAR